MVDTVESELVLLHINLEELSGNPSLEQFDIIMDKCKEIYDSVRKKSKGKIMWLGFDDYNRKDRFIFGNILPCNGIVDKLNLFLADIIDADDSFLDFKRIIAGIGIKNAYNDKGWYRWSSPYSKRTIEEIVREIYCQYCVTYCRTPKCIVLDCDGVLWDGVLNENGIEGIMISKKYSTFQKFILQMYNSGTILCLCTKNSEKSIRDVLAHHNGMILREELFSVIKANYRNKAENIQEISTILNLSLDSIVFIDDSECEINEMTSLVPDVQSILFDSYTIYEQLSCFKLNPKKQALADIRVSNYRNMQSMKHYGKDSAGLVDIHIARDFELSRISELSMRTNQRTNGSRLTIRELSNRIGQTYSVYYRDSINDYGLIGTMVVDGNTLMLFSVSCRVIGRSVEEQMIEYLKRTTHISEIIQGRTGKNDSFLEWLNKNILG